MVVKIRDQELILKYGFKTLFVYENIAGKSFALDSIQNEIVLFFSSLIASNEDIALDFPDFIEFLDENPKKLIEMREWLVMELKKQALLLGLSQDGDKKKATKRTRPTFQDD